MSYPEMMAVPLVGEMSPISMLKVVVFPAPTQKKNNVRMYPESFLYYINGN